MKLFSFDFYSKERIRLLGEQNNDLYKSNPIFILQDQIISWWFDRFVISGLRVYYWPAFIIGIQDDFQSLFNPRTYSICKL